MNTKRMVLLLGGVTGLALTAALARSADLQPLVVTALAGELRIQQGVPCGHDVDQTTPVTQGRVVITPATGIDVPGGKRFVLTRASVSFAPFSISRSCLGVSETRNYTEVGVQLGEITAFTATPAGGGIYNVSIPKSRFRIYEASMVNGGQESGFKYPSEDVTGTIDLVHGVVHMRVVVATKVHFKGGCFGLGCLIDETDNGTLTATLSGTGIFPDADGDGIPDQFDNCRFLPNRDQTVVASPIVTPPPAIAVASCANHQIGVATAVDFCDVLPVNVTSTATADFTIGRNVVTWTGLDASGRVGTASQTVTVVDKTPPAFTFVPPDLAVNSCGGVAIGVATATDDCAGTPTVANNAPKWFGVGTTPVTWTARDVSGNPSIATQMVTVQDTVRPVVTCAPVGVSGAGSFRVSASDACTAAPAIRLGGVSLVNGETITIAEIDRPGVTVVVDKGGVKHFTVGRGEGVITATDAAGNVASASCAVSR